MGLGRRSETLYSQVPHRYNQTLRPPNPIENLYSEQEQTRTDHRLTAIRTDFTTSMDTLKLMKRRADTDFTFWKALPKNRSSRESLPPSGPMACSSTDVSKQAKSIQTLPPSYRTKSSSVKTKGISLPKPSTLDQARTGPSLLKDDPRLALQLLREPATATSNSTDTATALKGVDVAGTEVACELGVMGRLSRSLRATVTRAYTLLHGPSLSAQLIRPSRTCNLAVWILSMPHVLAVAVLPKDSSAVPPISNSATGRLTTAKPIRTNFNAPAFSEWSFPILCVVILATCWFFARLKRWEPSNVLGTGAAIYWFLWLYLIRRADISPWYPWSIWSMGIIVLLCFIRLGYQNNVLFLSSVTAIPVTVGTVRYLPDLRSDHLAAFPPCLNVSLAFWIFGILVLTRTGNSLFNHARHLWDSMGRQRMGCRFIGAINISAINISAINISAMREAMRLTTLSLRGPPGWTDGRLVTESSVGLILDIPSGASNWYFLYTE